MRRLYFISLCGILFILLCQPPPPQLKAGYNYSLIKSIAIEAVKDYPNAQNSGETVEFALGDALKKLGFRIDEERHASAQVLAQAEGGGTALPNYDAVMVCSITEYNDQRIQRIPVEIEDKGPEPLANRSAYEEADADHPTSSSSVEDKVFTKTIVRSTDINCIDALVGVHLQMVDAQRGTTVWASDFSYSSLNKDVALKRCLNGALMSLRLILRK